MMVCLNLSIVVTDWFVIYSKLQSEKANKFSSTPALGASLFKYSLN